MTARNPLKRPAELMLNGDEVHELESPKARKKVSQYDLYTLNFMEQSR